MRPFRKLALASLLTAALPIAAASTVAPIVAHAAEAPSPTGATLYVMGSATCSVWTSARKAKASARLENYLVGVEDGLTLAHGFEFWRENGRVISGNSVFAAIDDYCSQNPNALLTTAATVLYQQRSGWIQNTIR